MGVIVPQPYASNKALGGAKLEGSAIFSASFKNVLSRTPDRCGDRRTWTWSGWLKPGFFDTSPFFGCIGSVQQTSIKWYIKMPEMGDGVGTQMIDWDSVAREVGGWYHYVFVLDSSNDIEEDRQRLYVNGKRIVKSVTTFNSLVWPAQNYQSSINEKGYQHQIGGRGDGASQWMDGYMSELNFLDGHASTDASEFGFRDELTGSWLPKKVDWRKSSSGTAVLNYYLNSTANLTDDKASSVTMTNSNCSTSAAATNTLGITTSISMDQSSKQYIASSIDGSTNDYAAVGNEYTIDYWYKQDANSTANGQTTLTLRTDTGSGAKVWYRDYLDTQSSAYGQRVAQMLGNLNGRTEDNRTWNFIYKGVNGSSTDNSYGAIDWCHVRITQNNIWYNGENKTGHDGQGSGGATTWLTGNVPRIGIDTSAFNIIVGNYSDGTTHGHKGEVGPVRIVPVDLGAPPSGGLTLTNGEPSDTAVGVASQYGPNSYYLPMDGTVGIGTDPNSVGADHSPHDNYFTAGGAGRSIEIDKATGALPILDTTSGGHIAIPNVRGSVGVAVTVYNSKYYLDGAEAGTVSFVPGQTVTFDTGDTTVGGHPFRLSPKSNGSHGTTDYSVDFDGTGDYLTLAASADFEFTGDHTIEMWIYPTDMSSGIVPYATGGSGSADQIYISATGELYYAYGITGTIYAGAGTIASNKWQHLAVAKSGTTLRAFVDGQAVAVGLNNTSTIGSSSATASIGYRVADGYHYVFGKISDFRIVKGTAVYTEPFTPPTTPLTNITNTKLLCCNSSTVTGSTVEPGTITANGDPSVSTDTAYDTYTFGTVTGAISEGTVGAATTITIPTTAPSTLYYYCTNHSGMGGAISIGATDPNVADPYAWKNVLALPLNGIEEDRDYSNIVNCTTALKSTTWTSVSDQRINNFYEQSVQFATSPGGNYAVEVATDSDFTLGTGPFTIECWIYSIDSSGTQNIVQVYQDGSAYYGMGIWSSYLDMYMDGGTANNLGTVVPGNEKWTHLAYVRDASANIYCFVDGVNQVSGVTDGTALSDASYVVYVGRHNPTTNAFVGYMQDFKMYRAAKYTKDFIPASPRPFVLPDTATSVAYGNKIAEPTAGSVAFAGNPYSEYLLTSVSSDYALGTDDFTVECWINPNESDNGPSPIVLGTGADAYSCILLYQHNATSGFGCYLSSTGSGWDIAMFADLNTGGYSLQRWHHYALTRDGSTFRIFLDGVLKDTYTSSASLYQNTNQISIAGPRDSDYFKGSMSNLRVIKGTALYTTSFIPPSSPLTNVTNTKLLCCQNKNDVTAYAVAPGAITANDSPVASTYNPFDTNIKTVRGSDTGYATMNQHNTGANFSTVTDGEYAPKVKGNGNLSVFFNVDGAGSKFKAVCATVPISARSGGKYYYEVSSPGGVYSQMGICRQDWLWQVGRDGWGISGSGGGWCYQSGGSYGNNKTSHHTSGPTWSTYGQIVGLEIDMDNYLITASVDGVRYEDSGDFSALVADNLEPLWLPIVTVGDWGSDCTNNETMYVNFGQRPFVYPPQNDAKAICTSNIQRPTYTNPNQAVGIVTYTGNNHVAKHIDIGFKPDYIITKDYGATGSSDGLWMHQNSLSGWDKWMTSSSGGGWSGNEVEQTNADGITGTTDGGYTIGTDADWNEASDPYLAMCFKAAGSQNTFNVNTGDPDMDVGYAAWADTGLASGTITPTACSVNQKAGFSIMKWVGTGSADTVPHGLGARADFVNIKACDSAQDWVAFHRGCGQTGGSGGEPDDYYVQLNMEATATSSNYWGTGGVTSDVFGLNGSSNTQNSDGATYVGYIWRNMPGLQHFGGYVGTGREGNYITLDFKPALLWLKSWAGVTGAWTAYSTAMNSVGNETTSYIIKPNTNGDAVTSTDEVCLMSNGFFINCTHNDVNGSGGTGGTSANYIYCAWSAEALYSIYGKGWNAN